MSQRMPDDEWADLVSQVGLGRRGEQMLREAERARTSEEEKDAQIKALEEQQRSLILRIHSMEANIDGLALALSSTTGRDAGGNPCWCPNHNGGHTERCEKRRSYLRLAGKLP